MRPAAVGLGEGQDHCADSMQVNAICKGARARVCVQVLAYKHTTARESKCSMYSTNHCVTPGIYLSFSLAASSSALFLRIPKFLALERSTRSFW